MRTEIEVTGLTGRQWEYIRENVPVDGREFLPGLPKACVTFEGPDDSTIFHVEMDVAEFIGLSLRLEMIKDEAAVADLAEGLLGETAGQGTDGDYPPGTKHVGSFEVG